MVPSQQWSSTGNGSQQWSSKNCGLSSMFIKYLRTVEFCSNDHLRTMDSQQWSSKDGGPSPIVIKYGVQSTMIISNDEQSTMVVKGRQIIINEQQRTTDSQQLLSEMVDSHQWLLMVSNGHQRTVASRKWLSKNSGQSEIVINGRLTVVNSH